MSLKRIEGELVLALKDKPWGSKELGRAVNKVVLGGAGRFVSGFVVSLPYVRNLGLSAPPAVDAILEAGALKQLGREGFQQMVKQAWMAANPNGMPGDGDPYVHFMGESLLEALWA